jgi:hypothetical protein
MTRRLLLSLIGAAGVGLIAVACADAEDGDGSPTAGDDGGASSPDGSGDGAARSDGGAADGAACDGCALDPVWPFAAATLPIDSRYDMLAAWGTSKADVWLVGSAGAAVHFDGSAWTATPTPTTQALYAVWGRGAADVWAVSNAGVVLRKTTGPWTLQNAIDANNPWTARAVRGVGPAALFVVGSGFIGDPDLGIFPASVMGSGRALPDGGTAWRASQGCFTCTDLHGLWGTGTEDLWVVGENGAAQHSAALDDAGAPRWVAKETATTQTLNAIWGSSPSDVWAVGEAGTIRHWTNDPSQRWALVPSGTTADLAAVWGSGPKDIWAVGDGATVIHYDGVAWSKRRPVIAAPNEAAPLRAVWGSGPEDVWIAGRGVVLHSTKAGGS